jgi:hypothetical protein
MDADGCSSQNFPIYATIAGVAVVTIPLTDYSDFLALRAQLERLGKAERYPVPPRSPIEADQEVKVFVTERLGKARVEATLQECRSRFGAHRTPSRTATYRFWQRLRRASG